ncbi:hypothetical protein [Kiloniella antarctica]|uniref:DUF2383 domain-containing protein n=1 Tax=Kiloniella antarctica TaxID=1550907 RepID=A0ABW5BQ19_9PROT
MIKSEANNKLVILDKINQTLSESTKALERLGRTCCMSDRSERIVDLEKNYAQLSTQIPSHTDETEKLNSLIEVITSLGSSIGALFATCCTPKRETLYIQLFKGLNTIHTCLWQLKGYNH